MKNVTDYDRAIESDDEDGRSYKNRAFIHIVNGSGEDARCCTIPVGSQTDPSLV